MNASGVIWDQNISFKLTGKFYSIRQVMLYGTKCWEVKCQQEHKMSVPEIEENIKNESIGGKVGEALFKQKMIDLHLRWFECVRRRPIEEDQEKL